MSALRITPLDPAGYRRTPWKNGGGVAIDIAGASVSDAASNDWNDTRWRFGRTRIDVAAPFSDLSGYDRMQMVVAGHGLVLQTQDGEIDLRQPGVPVRFAGDTPIVSRLEAGPVEVVNLIGDRGRIAIDLVLLTAHRAAELEAGVHVLYAAFGPCVVQCEGLEHELPSDHALQIESTLTVKVTGLRGRVVLGSAMPR